MSYRNHPIVDYLSILTADSVLVDVREPDEVAEGTLPDSRNIPLTEFVERLSELDASKPIVLFCRSGGRSAQAAQYLVDSGFSTVANLEGGMLAWQEQSS